MKFNLKNKTAVVTGGGSGIGEAISTTFAAMGAEVHILDMNIDNANSVVKSIEGAGGKAVAHTCDVSNEEQVKAIFSSINAENNALDIVVNNAGVAHVGNIENASSDDMDKLYNINIKGVFHCMQAAVAGFKKKGGGVILNLASIASSVGISDRFVYSMTKGAVATMTYSVAKDYVNQGIRCNCMSPARIHTPFVDGFVQKNYPGEEEVMLEKLSKTQPIGRMGTPQEVADLALFLCSEEASFITGSDFPIDGGYIKLQG